MEGILMEDEANLFSRNVMDVIIFSNYFTFGICTWNQVDILARKLLAGLISTSLAGRSVIAELSNRAIVDGLKAAASETESEKLRGEISHFCKGFDILADHRNFYVHDLVNIGFNQPSLNFPALGPMALHLIGKGKLKFYNQAVSAADVRNFCEKCVELAQFGQAILDDLQNPSAASQAADSGRVMPVWPSKVEKKYTHLI